MKCSIEDCDNPCEGTTLLCATHNYENRKAERQANKVKVIRPVKKVSEKRADELKEYPKKKKKYLEHKMACELHFEGCTVTSTDIHHVSLSAANFLNEDTWIGCCRSCHSRAENMSAEERRERNLLTD